jgi:hypothetical protein
MHRRPEHSVAGGDVSVFQHGQTTADVPGEGDDPVGRRPVTVQNGPTAIAALQARRLTRND